MAYNIIQDYSVQLHCGNNVYIIYFQECKSDGQHCCCVACCGRWGSWGLHAQLLLLSRLLHIFVLFHHGKLPVFIAQGKHLFCVIFLNI